ncbi:O-antigen ligase family protein [Flammeovirga yaeyamensis]|uniref:O-antigen ligase family protein n=1 Tax=Flammeovirga yaeyamensis TaxID=367791 RepID=A0AAX1N472_9BACT|nr:O-antigen ligase family protein [Flammeovirga yaeyamensis]MBB3699817.1 O-antigen ligase [Flammeovirga yaeyamensis]NMF36614.1 hypothetical protein [Flammeovirga yaeyamensis]QWG02339.1 O-antigen ligase family protein [Flammeovirga yaeyamensis]
MQIILKDKNRIGEFLVLLLFLSFFFENHILSKFYIFVFIYFIYLSRKRRFRLNFSYDFLVISLFGCWQLFTLFWSDSYKEVETKIFFVFNLLIFSHIRINNFTKLEKYIIIVVNLISLWLLIFSFHTYLEMRDPSVFFYHELSEVINFNAIYLSLIIASSVIFYVSNLKYTHHLLYIILPTIIIILLSSKNVIVLYLIILFYFLIKQLYLKKRIVFTLLFLLTCLIINSNFLQKRFLNLKKIDYHKVLFEDDVRDMKVPDISIRLFQIRVTGEILKENPKIFLFGTGIGSSKFKELILQKYDKYKLTHYRKTNTFISIHNQFIYTLFELGVLGLFLLLFTFAFFILKAIKTKNTFLLVLMMIFMSLSLTEMVLERQKGIICFIFFIYISIVRNHENSNIRYKRSS